MLEMVIDSIRVSLMNYQRVVILKEKESDRYLPIWIGPAEADAIAVQLQEISVPRPLTHDLLRSVIDNLGASINHILVNDLESDTFYAKISISLNGQHLDIDSRPAMPSPWRCGQRLRSSPKSTSWKKLGCCWTRKRESPSCPKTPLVPMARRSPRGEGRGGFAECPLSPISSTAWTWRTSARPGRGANVRETPPLNCPEQM